MLAVIRTQVLDYHRRIEGVGCGQMSTAQRNGAVLEGRIRESLAELLVHVVLHAIGTVISVVYHGPLVVGLVITAPVVVSEVTVGQGVSVRETAGRVDLAGNNLSGGKTTLC